MVWFYICALINILNMKRIANLCLLLLFTVLSTNTLKSQTTAETDSTKAKLTLNISSDFVSSYVWRGSEFGNSPAIQPTLSLTYKNLEIGGWGSVATNSTYKEIDLYAKYTYKKFAILFTDYYVPSSNGTSTSPNPDFLNYKDKTTAHSFEASLIFKGGDQFPLWILGGVFFYGNDKRWGYDASKDIAEDTYYSSYIEAGYTFTIQENSLDVLLGITPTSGAYGNKAGVVNMGFAGSRKIKISESFELPVKASLLFNPQASTAFFILGITL